MTLLIVAHGLVLAAALGLALFLLAADLVRARPADAPAVPAVPAVPAGVVAGRPRRLGPFVLEGKLGAGGMGEVYRARDLARGRDVAVKLLAPGASARDSERFEQEARLGAELRHPNVAGVYGSGEARDGTRYIVMELVEGETLEQLVQREGSQPPARVVRIGMQLCAALAVLHDRGLVHRDIKPENVILSRRGSDRVKIIDFGLIERIGAPPEPAAIVGTPLYISPEAIVAPATVDARSDLYGLGALLYFLLRGAPVFGGRSVIEVCGHHLHSAPEPPSAGREGTIPAELERLVLDCLAKDAAARPASAAELARRLADCLGPAERRPPRALGSLAAERAAQARGASGSAIAA